jgi:isopentenyl phosphate kinase
MPAVVLLKLGGSLITDKTREENARVEVIARLAGEIRDALPALATRGERLVVGHGSGSFGHRAARKAGIAGGLSSAAQLPGLAATQERAAALHWRVMAALLAAGLAPFSIAPSSAALADGGRLADFFTDPLRHALELGLLPVIYGDVVLDRSQGVAIASTERLFVRLCDLLPGGGLPVTRAVWLGETDGVYDADGATLPQLAAADRDRALAAIGQPAGVDVTGGMRHRASRRGSPTARWREPWAGRS